MKYFMLLSLIMSLSVKAETTSDDITLADEAISAPTMNIEGQYKVNAEETVKPQQKRKLSQSEKLKLYREKLEERNRIMVEKKMEQIRYQQELALAKKLEQSMNQTLKAIDTIE